MKQKLVESLRNISGLQVSISSISLLTLYIYQGGGAQVTLRQAQSFAQFQMLNLYGTSMEEFLLVSFFSKVFRVAQAGKETTTPSPQRCQVFER